MNIWSTIWVFEQGSLHPHSILLLGCVDMNMVVKLKSLGTQEKTNNHILCIYINSGLLGTL